MRLPVWRSRRAPKPGRRRRSPFNNSGPDGLNCGCVTEQLYVGGELGPSDWQLLAARGVSVVVNLQQEQQDLFAADERVDGYLWLPAPDQLAPTVQQLVMGVAFVRAALRNGKGVFVHCKAGQGRAPLLCACYLVSEGMTPLQAMVRVREARPLTQLTAAQSDALRLFSMQLERAQRTPREAPAEADPPPGASEAEVETAAPPVAPPPI